MVYFCGPSAGMRMLIIEDNRDKSTDGWFAENQPVGMQARASSNSRKLCPGL